MQNWIKCSERMPERYRPVLICDIYGEMWVACLSSSDKYWCDDYEVTYVSHWQPLPEAPNE